MTDIEAAWDTESFNEATESTPLHILDLLLDTVRNLLSIRLLLLPSLNRELSSIPVKSVLMELTVVVSDTVAHLIF